MEDASTPFTLPDLLTQRDIQATSQDGQQVLRLDLGQPLDAGDHQWMCMWNLYATKPTTRLIGKGASEGEDALQAVLRAIQVLRSLLLQLAKDNDAVLLWQGSKCGGIPDLVFDEA